MRYFEDMTYVEIGAAMEILPSTACRTVQRAIERLRKAVVEDPPRRDDF